MTLKRKFDIEEIKDFKICGNCKYWNVLAAKSLKDGKIIPNARAKCGFQISIDLSKNPSSVQKVYMLYSDGENCTKFEDRA